MEPDPTRRVLTRKRKPLSDCTNTFNSHSSPSLPITKRISSKNLHTPSNPTSPILSTPSLNSSSSLHGTGDVEASGCISIKYSRRRKSNQRKDKGKVVVIPVSSSYSNRRKDKGKAIATPLSSTPNLRISNSWEKSGRFEGVNVHKAKALTVPLRKKHRSVSSGQDALKDPVLQDFIEEQRAYFKAIDEFKLSEEEVESGDELD
ncbi:PREDICTED: uncharacterized protein LOC109355913 isoform X1 [Lupinus angustifolius]|uniref:uncharacterized protein LOC109355913 isoform X1 n=1 Tax=Lupinus angustifolius TaxID=3871 RepID=UPI00092E3BEB|nr:PREDICTED: uncharacterized protein LOC109355913 isoform X1 [Lupinus angustifolius]